MNELLKLKVDDFMTLIKRHKDELQNDSMTELETVAVEVKNSAKELFSHFSKLLQELANYTDRLEIKDLSSTLLFIEKSNITGDEIIYDYLKQVSLESNIERKVLLLKISYFLDPNLISKEILDKYVDIKKNYPLFWYDLLYRKDKNQAITELGNYIKDNRIPFQSLYPIVSRWIRYAKAGGLSEKFKNNIYSWNLCFNESDSKSFLLWLNENGMNTQNYENIVKFTKELDPYIIA